MTVSRTVKDVLARAEDRAMNALSDLGERLDLDWLVFNPFRMRMFHRYAARDSAAVVSGFEEVLPEAHHYADIGAGSAAHAAEAQRRGHPTIACERSVVGRLLARAQGVRCVSFDVTRQTPAKLDGPVDLAFSFEVAQHLPPSLGDRFLEFMAETGARWIVFSSAQPGQGGLRMVNQQTPARWAERFTRYGYRLDEARTRALRASFEDQEVSSPWLIKNTIVLVPTSALPR